MLCAENARTNLERVGGKRMENILPVIVGILPVQIAFVIYEEKILKSDRKWYLKFLYFLGFIIISFLIVGFLAWLLFAKLGI